MCAELDPLLHARDPHVGTSAVTAARGQEGVKVPGSGKPDPTDTHLSVWHRVAAAPQPSSQGWSLEIR